MDYDNVLARLMVERGFEVVEASPPPPLFERTLDELPPVQLPDGFTIQGVSNPDDGWLRAAVKYGAFGFDDDWENYAAAYARLLGSTVYGGERDLFVRSPDGQGASACTIWFDDVYGVGLFEPVATHPDFQGNGPGKAVMAEGMHRMAAAGMKRAVVGLDPNNTAARSLYTSMCFEASYYFVVYRKEVTSASIS